MSTTVQSSVEPKAERKTTGRSAGSVALDQWRGLALVLVLISHGFYFTHHVAGAGRIGVNLFFFISGILVFRSLASAKGSDGVVLRTFWWRRIRRLYPALLGFLGLMLAVLGAFRLLNLSFTYSDLGAFVRNLPEALTYTVDYDPHAPLTMGHLWSLAVEVQFYLFAPLLFLAGKGTRRRQQWVYSAALAGFVTYGFLRPLRAANLEAIRYHFETAVWPMLLGFWCEFAKGRLGHLWPKAVKPLYLGGVIALPVALVVMIAFPESKLMVIFIGTFLLVPCFLAYLFEISFPSPGGDALVWLGERTYSIYLLQQPLSIVGFLPTTLQPVGALASMLLGAVWFIIFEKPFLSTSRARQINATSPTPAAPVSMNAGLPERTCDMKSADNVASKIGGNIT